MKEEKKNLMSIEDIPYVVDQMKMMETLLGEVITKYFYDLRQKELFAYNFDRIKAGIFAIRALHSEHLSVATKHTRHDCFIASCGYPNYLKLLPRFSPSFVHPI